MSTYCVIWLEDNWISDKAMFVLLNFIYFICLVFRGTIMMNDSNPTTKLKTNLNKLKYTKNV